MKAVTTEQMRALDRQTIEEFHVPGEDLMDRAGFGVARAADALIQKAGFRDPLVQVFAGRGNNGGDAFVAARYLAEDELEVEVWLAGAVRDVAGDALKHFLKMKSAGVKVEELPTKDDWERLAEEVDGGDILIDGLLGTGATGPARGPAAGAIRYVNAMSERGLVLAIDVPSGLNADTGEAAGDVVRADVTATMGLPKRGLLAPAAIESVGVLDVVDLGLPRELIDSVESDLEAIAAADIRRLLPPRRRDSHKGTYGHVLVMAGAEGYPGAPRLAAEAALRGGAGLVTVLVPRSLAAVVASGAAELMVRGGPETEAGSLAAAAWGLIGDRLADFSAVVVGPGMSAHPDTLALVQRVISACTVPVVLDADALNVCAGRPGLFAGARCPLILTPHPGEMGRLIGRPASEVQGDRQAVARHAAEAFKAVVVLKGAGTLVAAPESPLHVNLTGNPGMATGGTGDVLAGLIGGLAAQGLAPIDAARAAAYLHGRAGDNAMWRGGSYSLTAGDLLLELPGAFRELVLR